MSFRATSNAALVTTASIPNLPNKGVEASVKQDVINDPKGAIEAVRVAISNSEGIIRT